MQSNNQFLNLCFDLNTIGQLQIPVFYTTPLIPNNVQLQAFQNFGGTSLPNASLNPVGAGSKEEELNKNQKEFPPRRGGGQKKTNWTPEQDEILKNLVQEEKLEWAQIVKRIPNRTYKMCYSRYQRIKEEKKVNWSQQEENKIRQLVTLFGKRWKHISQLVPNRTPKQIRERYLNYLRPNISHDKWTMEEDLLLLRLINKHGHKWKTIEKHMNKRSQNQLKNRFYGKLKKTLNQNSGQDVKLETSS